MPKADSFFAEVCCKGKRGRSWGERGTVKDCFNIGETLTSSCANVMIQRGRKRRWLPEEKCLGARVEGASTVTGGRRRLSRAAGGGGGGEACRVPGSVNEIVK